MTQEERIRRHAEIDELCRREYRRHRNKLDALYEIRHKLMSDPGCTHTHPDGSDSVTPDGMEHAICHYCHYMASLEREMITRY